MVETRWDDAPGAGLRRSDLFAAQPGGGKDGFAFLQISRC
jgi:hypothetical protein